MTEHTSLITCLFMAVLASSALPLSIAIPTPHAPNASDTHVKRAEFDDLFTEDFWVHQGCKAISGKDLDSYSPYDDKSKCPGDDFQWIRPADSISPGEKEFLEKRRPKLEKNWGQRMKDVGLADPLPRLPVVAMALSGGGYRAMISGSGMAFQQNNTAGSVGNILDVSSYVAGLSGGSWALASFLTNDAASPDYLAEEVWHLESNLVFPKDNKLDFFKDLICKSNVKEYQDKFQTGIVDLWALALSEKLFPKQFRGTKRPDLKWTEIPDRNPKVKAADVPWPIVIAVERSQPTDEQGVVDDDDPVWEFTLTELGTWMWGRAKKSQGAFTPIRWLGTKMMNGKPTPREKEGKKIRCYEGYDQAGFVVATSAALFNQGLVRKLDENKDLGFFTGDGDLKQDFIEEAYIFINKTEDDVAIYENPFKGWIDKENPLEGLNHIHLVDGGEAEENIPIEPFLQDSRHVDAIFAFDNSADTDNNWPNGNSLYRSYMKAKKQASLYNGRVRMPRVPTPEGFVNSGLNTRPVFFGCEDKDVPTIIYVPNYSWSTGSNSDTFKLDYSKRQVQAMIKNGRESLDLNGTVPDWGRCLTCAMIDNAVLQAGNKRDERCQSCFNEWCWDGKEDVTAGKKTENVVGALPALPLSVPIMKAAVVLKDTLEKAVDTVLPGGGAGS